MGVTVIESLAQFKEIIESEKTAVVDFWATWCGPCKVISPVFDKLSETHTKLGFYKVDVDVQEEIAAEVGIKAMPTFIFFNNGAEVGKVVGADPAKLRAALTLQSEEAK